MIIIKHKISVITKNFWSTDFFKVQLSEIFGDLFQFSYHSPDTNPIIPIYNADLILLHEPSVLVDMAKYIKVKCPIITMKRTISAEALENLLKIPPNKTAVIVNLDNYMVQETFANIYQLGINRLNLLTWYKGKSDFPKADYVITPRLYDFLPDTPAKKIVLGSRLLKPSVIYDVLSYFNTDIEISNEIIKEHALKVPSFLQGVNSLLESATTLSIQWELLFNNFSTGIMVINNKNIITSVNTLFANTLNKQSNYFINISLDNLINEFPQLALINSSNKIKDELIFINNKKMVLSLHDLKNKNVYLGKIITIDLYRDIQKTQQKIHRKIVGKTNVAKYTFDDIIGENKKLSHSISLSKKIANATSPILIYGESGTGKELLASAIHKYSNRSSNPYVTINCASIPDNLIEAELFGYEEGSFTGAKKGGSIGLFEKSNGGTIFLDEISELPLHLQGRLLRVLQEKEIRKIGANYNISIDARVIAASNKDLLQMVKENKLRNDLYFRLNVFQVNIPSLKDRRDDIPLLIKHFSKSFESPITTTKEFLLFANSYNWPGNIRELKNLLEFMYYTTEDDISVKNLPDYLKDQNFLNKIKYNPSVYLRELLMLKSIDYSDKNNLNTGRRSLKEYFSFNYYVISEIETREILKLLQDKNLITISQGRSGTSLTKKGIELLFKK